MSSEIKEYFVCGVCHKTMFKNMYMSTECEKCKNTSIFLYKIGQENKTFGGNII